MQKHPDSQFIDDRREGLEYYRIYRDYLEHEDELINRRLSWNLNLQGFLFAAYGVGMQVAAGRITAPNLLNHEKWFLYIVPEVGAIVGVLVLISVWAARIAIRGLERSWTNVVVQLRVEYLPRLTGGGEKWACRLGHFPQLGIPIVIVCAWIVLIVLHP